LKTLLVYFVASALYFSVAIFGERIETKAYGLQLVEGQTEGKTMLLPEQLEFLL